MKVILTHDWLTGMRGGERCLEVFCELFPQAPLYTLIHEKGSVSSIIEDRPIHTSSLQSISFLRKKYRHFLPLLPRLMKNFPIDEDVDLVLSSSHCVAKMIKKPQQAKHWCYLYTPMRYMWDLFDDYFGPEKVSSFTRFAAQSMAPYLKRVDYLSNRSVDQFVTISNHIARRTERNYDRESEIIYPPVDIERFSSKENKKIEQWDLVVSALVPYKRVDLAIQASNQLKHPLKIIGTGPEEMHLRKMAGPQVEFLGALNDEAVTDHMERCRTFIFPGEEDFGITPVEAQAAGRPVVAFAKGGALETIIPEGANQTGVFFENQTIEDLVNALQLADTISWDARKLKENAQKFSRQRFVDEVKTSLSRFARVHWEKDVF